MSFTLTDPQVSDRALGIAARVETFVRETVAPFEKDKRRTAHGTSDDLARELKGLARATQAC